MTECQTRARVVADPPADDGRDALVVPRVGREAERGGGAERDAGAHRAGADVLDRMVHGAPVRLGARRARGIERVALVGGRMPHPVAERVAGVPVEPPVDHRPAHVRHRRPDRHVRALVGQPAPARLGRQGGRVEEAVERVEAERVARRDRPGGDRRDRHRVRRRHRPREEVVERRVVHSCGLVQGAPVAALVLEGEHRDPTLPAGVARRGYLSWSCAAGRGRPRARRRRARRPGRPGGGARVVQREARWWMRRSCGGRGRATGGPFASHAVEAALAELDQEQVDDDQRRENAEEAHRQRGEAEDARERRERQQDADRHADERGDEQRRARPCCGRRARGGCGWRRSPGSGWPATRRTSPSGTASRPR